MMRLPTILVGKRVLLVDPNAQSASHLKALLEQFSLEVTVTYCGLEARNLARHRSFDLALMDTALTTDDWHATTRGLNRAHCGGILPIIALVDNLNCVTNNADNLCGIDALIVKPVDVQALIAKLTRIVEHTTSEIFRPFDLDRALDSTFVVGRRAGR